MSSNPLALGQKLISNCSVSKVLQWLKIYNKMYVYHLESTRSPLLLCSQVSHLQSVMRKTYQIMNKTQYQIMLTSNRRLSNALKLRYRRYDIFQHLRFLTPRTYRRFEK